ncbi:MAG: PQQ-dependent sugar dehydrogenase [Calditrichaceae bacterium]
MKNILIFLIFMISIAHAQFDLEVAFPHLNFTQPVDLQNAGDGSNRIFVVEQRGIIHVFENDSSVLATDIFIDLQDSVNDAGSEEGLLGLAFHPNYEENGYFYVNYTDASPRRTVIARYQVSENEPNKADPESELVLLQFNQPESNHNGGQLAFGPDGYLYIATGDGGGSGDQHGEFGNGQDRTTLLGNILRIDVDNADDGLNYAIPEGNPFVGNQNDYREEIFAYGLRNPWRFSFDKETGWLWAGDVGQGDYEEVDIIESGNNYGWRIMEGLHCYNSEECDQTGLTLPIWEYPHGTGYSITGGYVYYGAQCSGIEREIYICRLCNQLDLGVNL